MTDIERMSRAADELMPAIHRYMIRQPLVAYAMKDLGLHLDDVARYGTLTMTPWPDDQMDQVLISVQKRGPVDRRDLAYTMRRTRQRPVPQSGVWYDLDGEAWAYMFQGDTGHLTHQHTQEPVSWMSPTLHRFGTTFLINHVVWQTTHLLYQDSLTAVRMWIDDHDTRGLLILLDVLVKHGKITNLGALIALESKN
jgi:hypothetical protein